jgi:hypothetical protein
MTAKRWMLLGSLVAIGSVSCGDKADPVEPSGGSAGTGSPQAGKGGSGGSGTSGSAGTQAVSGSSGSGTSGAGPSAGTTGGTGVGGSPAAGAGGSAPTAGTGTAGSSGGVAGTGTGGGSAGTGMAGTGAGACDTPPTISSATLAEKIKTVGVIEWTTAVQGMTAARIEFGRDTNYGMEAPVTPAEGPNFRTLLLGMKQDTEYHFRIVVTGPGGDCAGPDQTITTDFLPSGLPVVRVEPATAAGTYGGYLITGRYSQMGGMAPAYILDADGEYVWAYQVASDVTGARMSYDGKHMWINKANVPNGGSNVHRVAMDGSTDENLSDKFSGQNHQMTVLPDETVGFYAYGSQCDDVKEYNPTTGAVRTVVNSQMAHGASAPCHLNAIEYSPEDDTYVFSDLENDNITKVKRSDGSTVWVLGGDTADFTGQGATWQTQHGIDVLGVDRILFFNNQGDNGGSTAIEMLLNLDGMTASRAWTYTANPSIRNDIMGDVQRLDNGNTIVAYSTRGIVHEVNAEGMLLQALTWGSSGQFGYIQKRKSLYGPPPR